MIKETVYNGTDNAIDVICKKNGAAQSLSAVTKVELIDYGDAFSLDSDVDTDVFTWTGLSYTGQINMVLGGESIPEGTYRCHLLTTDATDILCWGDIELEFITP